MNKIDNIYFQPFSTVITYDNGIKTHVKNDKRLKIYMLFSELILKLQKESPHCNDIISVTEIHFITKEDINIFFTIEGMKNDFDWFQIKNENFINIINEKINEIINNE